MAGYHGVMSEVPKRRSWIPAKANPTATRKSLIISAVLGAMGFPFLWYFSEFPAWLLLVGIPLGAALGALIDWQMD